MEELRQSFRDAEKRASEADKSLQTAKEELERVRPFEKEVKEKNLLIGKLRHEAVTLNDHLTKALRFLKKGKPEDNVDRYVYPPILQSLLLTWTVQTYRHQPPAAFPYLGQIRPEEIPNPAAHCSIIGMDRW